MSNPVRSVVVVSLGSIGRRHVRLIHQTYPDVSITAVRRADSKPCEEDKHVTRRYHSVADALSDGVDAAIIASPANLHAQHAIPFIQAQIPILIEKPLASSMNMVDDIQRCIVESGTNPAKVMVGYVLRHHPAYQRLVSAVNSQAYGSVTGAVIQARSFLPDWRPGQDYLRTVSADRALGGGVLRELSHEIDIANSLVGPIEICAGAKNAKSILGIKAEERVHVLASGAGNAPVSIVLDFASYTNVRQTTISFEAGEITWDVANRRIIESTQRETPRIESYNDDGDAMYVQQLRHFFDSIENRFYPSPSVRDGAEVVRIIDSIESKTWNVD